MPGPPSALPITVAATFVFVIALAYLFVALLYLGIALLIKTVYKWARIHK